MPIVLRLQLPYHSDVFRHYQALRQLVRKPTFGGAALVAASSDVTALGLVDIVSDVARQIGSVDTIIARDVDERRELGRRQPDPESDPLLRAVLARLGQAAGAALTIVGGDRNLASAVCYAGKRLGFTAVCWIGGDGGDGSGDLAAASPDMKTQEVNPLDRLIGS